MVFPFFEAWLGRPVGDRWVCGSGWLAAQGTSWALSVAALVLQLTRAVVPVGELADPAAIEMGEAAASGTGGGEVDADVVQV
jgi:hypothetical protein